MEAHALVLTHAVVQVTTQEVTAKQIIVSAFLLNKENASYINDLLDNVDNFSSFSQISTL